jgi:hypothetical protein
VSLTVNNASDAADTHPGDGVCDIGNGTCTLRAAVQEADAHPTTGVNTITLAVNPTLTLSGPAGGPLATTEPITIAGNGHTVNAGGFRLFDVVRASLTVDDATLTKSPPGAGGGLLVASGASATVDNSTLSANSAGGADGGGAMVQPGGSLTVTNSTVSGNTGVHGAGLYDDGGTLVVDHSTISANTASSFGGAVGQQGGTVTITHSLLTGNSAEAVWQGSGTLSVVDSTISGNSASVGVGALDVTGTATVRASTVSGNTGRYAISGIGPVTLTGTAVDNPTTNCFGNVSSGGYDLISDGSCGTPASTDLIGARAALGPLAANGGPTRTQLPASNSPLIDAIPSGTAGLCDSSTPDDQRGVARPQGSACDIGAVEGHGATPLLGLSLTVNNASDAVDAHPGDGVCDIGNGTCTLRAAVQEVDARPMPNVITIAAGVNPTLTIPKAGFDPVNNGDLNVIGDLTIHGNGAVINANGLDRAFNLASGFAVDMDDVTIEGGSTNQNGGGIYAHSTGLTVNLTDVTLSGNTASSGSDGGGLHADGRVTLDSSTVSGNTATLGGGLYVSGGLAITNSTLSGNHGSGGALYTTGSAQIVLSSFAGNDTTTEAIGGGGPITLSGDALADSGTECNATIVSGGYNVAGDATCNLTGTGDQPNTAALLGSLANNGGPTETMYPQTGSPLIDAIPSGTSGLCDGSIPTDQRGFTRPHGPGCDIGSVESGIPLGPPSHAF